MFREASEPPPMSKSARNHFPSPERCASLYPGCPTLRPDPIDAVNANLTAHVNDDPIVHALPVTETEKWGLRFSTTPKKGAWGGGGGGCRCGFELISEPTTCHCSPCLGTNKAALVSNSAQMLRSNPESCLRVYSIMRLAAPNQTYLGEERVPLEPPLRL